MHATTGIPLVNVPREIYVPLTSRELALLVVTEVSKEGGPRSLRHRAHSGTTQEYLHMITEAIRVFFDDPGHSLLYLKAYHHMGEYSLISHRSPEVVSSKIVITAPRYLDEILGWSGGYNDR